MRPHGWRPERATTVQPASSADFKAFSTSFFGCRGLLKEDPTLRCCHLSTEGGTLEAVLVRAPTVVRAFARQLCSGRLEHVKVSRVRRSGAGNRLVPCGRYTADVALSLALRPRDRRQSLTWISNSVGARPWHDAAAQRRLVVRPALAPKPLALALRCQARGAAGSRATTSRAPPATARRRVGIAACRPLRVPAGQSRMASPMGREAQRTTGDCQSSSPRRLIGTLLAGIGPSGEGCVGAPSSDSAPERDRKGWERGRRLSDPPPWAS
jgi:hypothetical protein